jgi:hypothetical protein
MLYFGLGDSCYGRHFNQLNCASFACSQTSDMDTECDVTGKAAKVLTFNF